MVLHRFLFVSRRPNEQYRRYHHQKCKRPADFAASSNERQPARTLSSGGKDPRNRVHLAQPLAVSTWPLLSISSLLQVYPSPGLAIHPPTLVSTQANTCIRNIYLQITRHAPLPALHVRETRQQVRLSRESHAPNNPMLEASARQKNHTATEAPRRPLRHLLESL